MSFITLKTNFPLTLGAEKGMGSKTVRNANGFAFSLIFVLAGFSQKPGALTEVGMSRFQHRGSILLALNHGE